MKQGNYNDYPKGFLGEFNKPVTFRLLGIKPDPDIKDGWLIPNANIPASSSVQFKDDEGNVTKVDLGYIKGVEKADGSVELDRDGLLIGPSNGGMIMCDPANPKDIPKYHYLMNCPFNVDSPYTFDSAEKLIQVWDPERNAQKKIKNRGVMKEALKSASSLPESRVAPLYAVLGTLNPANLSISEMRDEIENLAMDQPQLVLDKIGSEGKVAGKIVDTTNDSGVKTTEELVDLAISMGKANLLQPQLMYRTEDGKELFKFEKKSEGKGSAKEQFIAHVNEDDDFRAIIEALVE